MEKKKASLILEDGTEFHGFSFGAPVSTSGEVVFNTAMTGYPESLTDPSYCGQILVLTYPMIGNYGVPPESSEDGLLRFFESDKIHVKALVISDYSFEHSHWNATQSLDEWLRAEGVPGIYGVDTRQITKIIRERGVMPGRIVVEGSGEPADHREDLSCTNPVPMVCGKGVETYGDGDVKIVLVDCGCKFNIIRHLTARGAKVIRVPWDYDFTTLDYDGVMLGNGPGDPTSCEVTASHVRKAMEGDKPIFGICLGHQLMALASGAKTYKLKYGHRSHNQPVIESGTNRAFITPQNHGYAVDTETLAEGWEPWFTNLNDGTNEGIRHREKPFFSVQFHPEAASGPGDTEYLFDKFIDLCRK